MKEPSRKSFSQRAEGKEKRKKKRFLQRPEAAQATQTSEQIQREDGTGKHFPIVGIGASAGGLDAFSQLLQNLPVDTGMAFVLVQHLDPDHPSALTQLLARTTALPVTEVTHGTKVVPNHVYVIPPNTCMEIGRGVLKLRPREKIPGAHRSIDVFFESLAYDQGERAIGIVLSGTATDGTKGLETIKAEGGITLAQDDSAKYGSMPRSAVAAGCVDLVFSPKQIAAELARLAKHPLVDVRRTKLTKRSGAAGVSKDGDGAPDEEAEPSTSADRDGEKEFKKILLLLRNHRGVDFSLYKMSTIHRRIIRRMVLNKQKALHEYAQFLKGKPEELDRLYSDLLINVTSFFRNPEAFDALKLQVFPSLLEHQRQDDPVRVWALGCSTGQEPYSIAMAFTEFCDNLPRAPKLQVFATDLSEPMLERARMGLYNKNLMADISAERLKRFFVEEQGGYRVCKSLRELCVFARHNVLTDPPFSRMDLISCRNMLIYLELESQKRIMPNLHYALKPGGFLWLGASEAVGGFANLFTPADKRQKIFCKKHGAVPRYQLPLSPGQRTESKGAAIGKRETPPDNSRAELNAQREADRLMVNEFGPPSALINAELEVLQFRGSTRDYLEPPTGTASFDLLKMARAGLMLPLRAAINEAKKENRRVCRKNVRLDDDGRVRLVNIQAIPLKNLEERCYLILFEEASESGANRRNRRPLPEPPTEGRTPPAGEESRRIADLERDLAEARDYARSLQEQHEAGSEEIQASTEEVQSANEELQSINEELETSKEELESTNEELTTVNEEMASRNGELNRLNSDLNNLQASTKLPIVLLGRDLAISHFSPQAEKQFDLVAEDIGRPFGKVRHGLDLPDLEAFIADVISSARQSECEVQDYQGRWHLLHVRPYLTPDHNVDGAVLVLTDIHTVKEAEQAVTAALHFAESVLRTVRDPFLVLDADLRVERANNAFYDIFRMSPAAVEGRTVFEIDHGHWNIPKLRELLNDILTRDTYFDNLEVTIESGHLGARTILLNARKLDENTGQPAKILLGIHDITDLLHAQAQMRRSELRYRTLFEAAKDGVLVIDPDTRKIVEANPFITELVGYSHETLLGKELFEIGLLKDEEASRKAFEELNRNGFIRYDDLPLETKNGQRREVEFISNLYEEDGARIIQCNIRDVTARKRIELELRQAHTQLADRAGQLEKAVNERTAELTTTNKQLEAFVYSIAHDLRAPLRAMQGFSAMLVEEAGATLNEAGQSHAERINKSARYMDALLQDLLAFSQISQQRVELVPVSLETVVASVLFRLEKDIQDIKACVKSVGPWPVVQAHEPTLAQVLFNLISNALKFITADSSPQLCLQAEERGEFIRVWVEDNGIGIASSHQEQIFRIFTRLHGDKYPGTGIGLAIVQKGIEHMGGRAGVKSTFGQGSRFWFELRKSSGASNI